jgi:hypothetical protein
MNASTRARMVFEAFLLALAVLMSSCGPPNSQHADVKFDANVAHPAYANSGPRVLIDEAHRNFHTATGRYRPFATLIQNDGYRVNSNREKFTAASLEPGVILVISNAMGPNNREWESAFAVDEVQAVKDWVSGGGSLLLIADHFPMGGAAEGLSKAFGVEMSKGVTEDTLNCDPSDPASLIFSRENGLLVSHPVTEGQKREDSVARVVTFTGQSLSVPPDGVGFLKLSASASDRRPLAPKIEKSGNDVRVTPQYADPVPATGRSQGVALEFGKGRVVILGEAAMMTAQISNDGHPFGMNVPGNDDHQLALNIMHWLSRLD